MNVMVNQQVRESLLPPQILYNDKIERIRLSEYDKEIPPQAIHFTISDGFSG